MFLAMVLAAVAAEPPLPEDIQAAYAWFDKLGLPSLKGRKLVRVSVKEPESKYGDDACYSPSKGDFPPSQVFLLARTSNSVTVLTLDLVDVTVPEYPRLMKEHGGDLELDCTDLDLETEASKWLKEMRASKKCPGWRFGQRLTDRGQTFVMSRACAANGHHELARKLYAAAAVMASGHAAQEDDTDRATFSSRLQADVAHALVWRTVELFANDGVPRTELLRRFECIADQCTMSQHVDSAREYAAVLKRMVREDEKWAEARGRRAGREPTPEEQVADLIHSLREINETEWLFSGKPGPVEELKKIGYPAVPRLLDALDDTALTRTVHCWQTSSFSHHVLRVDLYANLVLGEITGTIPPDDGSFVAIGRPSSEDTLPTKWYRDWWQNMREKGELEVLSVHTAWGRHYSPEQARRLVARYPDKALDMIVAGVDNALQRALGNEGEGELDRYEQEVVSGLFSAAAGIPGKQAETFLRQHMTTGTSLETRLAAAKNLHRRGSPGAVGHAVTEWKAVTDADLEPEKRGDFIPIGAAGASQPAGPRKLIVFLATCGKKEGIAALGRSLRERSPYVRQLVLSAFLPDWFEEPLQRNLDGLDMTFTGERTNVNHNVMPSDTLRDLLAETLYDAERCNPPVDWLDELLPEESSPRICDLAVCVLARHWPDTYRFDPNRTLEEREKQRTACLNATRELRGLPALVLLGGRFFEGVDGKRVVALLDRVAAGEEGADAARSEVESLGLPALRHVIPYADSLGAEHPARGAVKAIALHLSGVVREVGCVQVPMPETLKPLLDELTGEFEGKPVTGAALVTFFTKALATPPANMSGLTLTADRGKDLTGVTIDLQTGSVPLASSNATHWFRADFVSAGDDVLLSPRGRADSVRELDRACGRLLAERIDEALAAGPDVPVTVRLEWVRAAGDEE